jgi:mono/diheme cytochrome c family protein
MFRPLALCSLIATLLVTSSGQIDAAPTPAQRKELAAIQKQVSGIASLLRKRQYEEAEETLKKLMEEADKVIKSGQFSEGDRAVVSLRRLIDSNRQRVAKAQGKPDPTLVSFTKDVAPIFQARCRNCHVGNGNSGNLSLNSYAAMGRGGKSGALLIPKNPQRSLLMARLVNPQNRMPRNGQPLTNEQLMTINKWIAQGAPFDGENPQTALADLGKSLTKPAAGGPPQPAPTISVATGNEKVSFVKDIAPTIVNLCGRCHGGNNPRSGLSLATFAGMMKGGDSGRVVIPGNLEGSRLWRLVGAGDQPRMPQGRARITRAFHANLRTWIEEGAKFDGDNANLPLRQLVPTDEELLAARLAALSPAEFRSFRDERTQDQWKRVSPRVTARYISSSPEFFIYGDVSEERLKQVSDWAEAHAQKLKSLFGVKATPMFGGRLTIFVMKDRFGYTEFNQVIHRRSTARDVHGHSTVTTGYEDAYVVLEDIGDDSGTTHGGLRVSLLEHISGAWLKKPGTSLPDWVIRGTGLALARQAVGGNQYIDGLQDGAVDSLQGIEKPEDVFTDGRFGPGDIGPIGYTLVNFMIKAGGASKFGRFVAQLQSGANVAASVKAVYPPADLKALGSSYLQSLSPK